VLEATGVTYLRSESPDDVPATVAAAPTMVFQAGRARRDKWVLVVTGDGELLMNLGSLATIAVLNAPNLSIVCVDHGHYGETGYQRSHTSLGVDLEKIAAASGIKRSLAIERELEIAAGVRLIHEGNGASFVLLRVKPTEPPAYKRDLDPATCRTRFRLANVRAA
jgi:phosphonopyruvate decarboxylase